MLCSTAPTNFIPGRCSAQHPCRQELCRVATRQSHCSSRLWGHSSERCPARGFRVASRCTGVNKPSETKEADAGEIFSRLTCIQRQLDIAVAEESYSLAAQLRDEMKSVYNSLPPVQQYTYQQVKVLHTGSTEEKLQAISSLGATGDNAVLPHLAALLPESTFQDKAQSAMWSIFMRCKDPVATDALLEGTRIMGNDRLYAQAMELFDQVVKRCPTFAEGYNKRATLLYMQRRFRESIEECRTVLSMQPYHFGAASGMGLCHLQLGEYEEAIAAFEVALSINPSLADIKKMATNLKQQLKQNKKEEQGQGPP